MEALYWLVAGGIAGVIAARFVKSSTYKAANSVVSGMGGGFLAGWIVGPFGSGMNKLLGAGSVFPLGSVVIALVAGAITAAAVKSLTADYE